MAGRKRHPLGQLIEDVMSEHSYSYADLSARALARKSQISRAYIQSLATQPLKTLVPDTLLALADALGVPAGRVVEAAVESLEWPRGIPTPLGRPSDWSVETAIQTDPELSAGEKAMLLAQVAAARSQHTGSGTVTPIRRPLPTPPTAPPKPKPKPSPGGESRGPANLRRRSTGH